MTIVEQEKVVNEKLQNIDELRRELETAQTSMRLKETDLGETKVRLDECLQKLREARDKIKENENGPSVDCLIVIHCSVFIDTVCWVMFGL